MEFMHCTTCSALVNINPTGVCLGCQRGFTNTPQEDSWRHSEERALLKLTEEKKEMLQKITMEEKPKNKKQAGRRKKAKS